MVKSLLFIILTIAMFPFSGHLTVLVLLSGLLFITFLSKLNSGVININQNDVHRNKYFIFFMISLLLYSLLSIIWVKDIGGWVYYNVYLFIATISLVVSNYVLNTKKNFYEVFRFISIASIVHSVIGWINVLTGKYIFSTSPLVPDFREKGNPLSFFNNTNDFATFLVFSIFINVIVLSNSDKKIEKAFLSFNIISMILLLYKTMSRANYLAFLLGVTVFILLQVANKRTIYFSAILGSSLIISFLSIPQVNRYVFDFVTTKFFNAGDMIRINLLRNGIHFLNQSKGIGIGAGNIAYYLESYSIYETNNISSIHNWWMDILVTYGLIFFVLYLIYYFKLVRGFVNLMKSNDKFVYTSSIGFISILGSYLIGAISTSTNFPIIWIWLFFSLMISFLGVENKEDF